MLHRDQLARKVEHFCLLLDDKGRRRKIAGEPIPAQLSYDDFLAADWHGEITTGWIVACAILGRSAPGIVQGSAAKTVQACSQARPQYANLGICS